MFSELDEWGDAEEDEVLFESEELNSQYFVDDDEPEFTVVDDDLPVLPLRGIVVYPMMWFPLPVGQKRSIRLVEDTLPKNRMIALVASRDEGVEEPTPDQIHRIGTAAQIHRVLKTPDGTMRLVIQGMERIRVIEYIGEEPYLRARIEVIPEEMSETLEMEAAVRAVQELFRRLIDLEPHMPEELAIMALNVKDARQLAYLVASSMRLNFEDMQQLLEIDLIYDKLLRLTQLMKKEIEVLELGRKIQSEAQGEMERMQREFYLREQIKAIQKELGEEDEQQADIRELEERIVAAGMSEEAKKEAMRELSRMRRMPIQAAEYSVIKTYLDLLVSLPWEQSTSDKLDIGFARQVLDDDHYGLQEIKERILEFLAVRKLRAERRAAAPVEDTVHDQIRREREGVVLCFVGPPGVGKTSLGISIARAMGRKFVRLALGGVRDEADIRGFRRTYIGSMPGRIIQSLRRIESRNPVFMLDEVDKLGRDFRGDPSNALLEVLDPEQNREFRDHYLDVAFDLSQVMFITTANMLDTVPGPLRDRMEIIELSSYTEDEKVQIAQGYLLPRQIKENGLLVEEAEFTEGALREIIQGYTREAGVRNLERQIGKVCRKVASQVAAGTLARPTDALAEPAAATPTPSTNGKSKGRGKKKNSDATPQAPARYHAIDKQQVLQYLGKREIHEEEIVERAEAPGVAVGLAWTVTGGDIMFFEATRSPGDKGFTLTGQLGDVMKESAQAALSYVRSRASTLNIDPEIFRKSDIHLHIPAGAIPKDGPSAGITMATALVSLLTGRPLLPKIGMTGEITLRGKVLPIGGVKEKVLAATRFGLETIILPKRNEVDLDDLPTSVRDKLKFVLVDTVDEVWAAALSDVAPGSETPEIKEFVGGAVESVKLH